MAFDYSEILRRDPASRQATSLPVGLTFAAPLCGFTTAKQTTPRMTLPSGGGCF
jgi:hypothetical protein